MVSVLGLGGFHIGKLKTDAEATKLIHEAIDAGVTFLDNAWEYHDGKSETRMGNAIKDRRQRVFLMTKVCTHGRDAKTAMRQLEQSLKRLKTDYLDLWQIHECAYYNDPEKTAATFVEHDGEHRAVAHRVEQNHPGLVLEDDALEATLGERLAHPAGRIDQTGCQRTRERGLGQEPAGRLHERALAVDQRGGTEALGEAPQLALGGRPFIEVDEVHGDAPLGEEALRLARVLAVLEAEDL